ncbi:MAG: NADH-quinone oxidoreductase subunit NuoE [Rhodospirillaceae bacterium]
MTADHHQPSSFAFEGDYLEKAKWHISKYPEGREQSAVMPLLDLAQRQHGGWIPQAAIEYIADTLGMASIRVYEVATFYTMYNLHPVGEHFVQVCTNLPCWLRGSDQIMEACKKVTGCSNGQTSEDGKFTVLEVECLGACVNAPMMQIGDDYYEDLNSASAEAVLRALQNGEKPKVGSQSGRHTCEPAGGLTSLTEFYPDGAPKAGGDD